MFKKIAFLVMALISAVLGLAAIQPSHYVISREIQVNAPKEKIFPYLNSTKLAEQWGPWKEVDPQATMVQSGPESGVGAKSSWNSKGQLGTGSATIVESVVNERVNIRLEYTQPMIMQQDAQYLLRSEGSASVVTWRVEGYNTFFGRVMCLFFNMDKVVGGMFEIGLGKLKVLAEKP